MHILSNITSWNNLRKINDEITYSSHLHIHVFPLCSISVYIVSSFIYQWYLCACHFQCWLMKCSYKCVGMQMDIKKIESSSKLYIPPCGPFLCGKFFHTKSCWCCIGNPTICTVNKKDCDSNPQCHPSVKFEFLKN